MGKLNGKIALVTGASKGIGAEIAKELAKEGAVVIVNYSSSKAWADRVVSDIVGFGGRALAIQANVANQDETTRMMGEIRSQFQKIDILVNNAGIYAFAPLEQITEEHFMQQFRVNVLGALWVTQGAVPLMTEGGSIINISSMVSLSAPPNCSVYSGTKGALDSITDSLARELAPKNIRVNSVNPGMVETEGVHTAGFLGTEFSENIKKQTPLGRLGQPSDIAKAVVFLATNDAGWITGTILPVAGGWPQF